MGKPGPADRTRFPAGAKPTGHAGPRFKRGPARHTRRHGLNGSLIVSLTSHRRRFHVLGKTLRCLLDQTISPDRIILWIARRDIQALPRSILPQMRRGVEVRTCDDLQSYNKIIHALRSFPDSFIATADDDQYYPPQWLARLVSAYDPRSKAIPCHRAHAMTYRQPGVPDYYLRWQWNVARDDASAHVFMTGVSGVLYPPNCLHPDVTRADLFRRLCLAADDVWLNWMAWRSGYVFKLSGARVTMIEWSGCARSALRYGNVHADGNDAAISRMLSAYGLPRPCG
jgi:hypothetical protein